jgi:hypothetical protein
MKRAWFQIHLSTAIVLMFVAGGLSFANMRPKTVRYNIEMETMTRAHLKNALRRMTTQASWIMARKLSA